MGCLLVLLAAAFPRVMLVLYWIARPTRMDAIFTSVLWPILGIVFLPFATLMYILLWMPGEGVSGGDWAWVGLAGLIDVVHWAASANQRRDVVPSRI